MISGDLTWNADEQDFNHARVFIEALGTKTGVSSDKILVVPGNHDIKWLEAQEGELRVTPAPDADLPYRNFYELLYKQPPNQFLQHIVNDDKIALVGLNSARIETRGKGMGYAGGNQLDSVFSELRERKNSDYLLKVAVLHHHLVPVFHLEILPQDFQSHISLTLDAEAVIRRFIREDVKIVLHGHRHQPFFAVERRIFGEKHLSLRELAICGTGSSAVSDEYLYSFRRNCYSVLSITDRSYTAMTRYSADSGRGFETHKTHQEWFT